MSFFDEIETTVANVKLLSAGGDPIVLNLKPFEELAECEKKCRDRLDAKKMSTIETTGWYQFSRYLKDIHHGTFVKFARAVFDYKAKSLLKRQNFAKEMNKRFLENGGTEAESVEDAPEPSKKGSQEPSKGSQEDAAFEEVKLGEWLAKDNAGCLEKVTAGLGAADEDLFDPVLALMAEYYEKNLKKGYLETEHFKRHVQIVELTEREITQPQFRVFRVLGKGAFGAVSACQKTDTQAMYAIKLMDKKMVKKNGSETLVVNERDILARLDSRFVLDLAYSFHDQENLYIVFKMLGGGDLEFHLNNEEENVFGDVRARFYTAQVLLGLEAMHDQHIVYRDLKPANVLLDSDGHVVISDLGLAVEVLPDKGLRQAAGTAGYWPPEIMSRRGTYDSSDWWTLGVMLYQMLTGGKPQCTCDEAKREWCSFGYSEEEEAFAKDKENQGPHKLDIDYSEIKDPDTVDFLKQLFTVDPKKRLGYHNTNALKAHPYFKTIDFEKMSKGEVEAPYKPDGGVHAESIADVGAFDKSEFKKVQLTEEDNKEYKDFYFVQGKNLQRELVGALTKMDDPALVAAAENNATKADSGCCTIL